MKILALPTFTITNVFAKKVNKQIFYIFLFTFLSGALRKWVFVSGAVGNVILLLQLLTPYLLLRAPNGTKSIGETGIITAYLFALVLLALNPLNLTIYHGLLGIILHFGFWFGLNYYFVNRDKIDLSPLTKWVLIFCAGEIVLGFIQYQLPPNSFINRYANVEALNSKSIATVGNAVRVTGSFSFISGYTAFLNFSMLFIWYLLRIKYNYNIIALLLAGVIVGAFMSGSRGAVAINLIILAAILYSEFTATTIFNFVRKLFWPVILVILFQLGTGGGSKIEQQINTSYENFMKRFDKGVESGEQEERISGELEKILAFKYQYPLMGIGLGATYQGAIAAFGKSPLIDAYGYVEGEQDRLILEGGLILFIFKILLFIWLYRQLQMPVLAKLILCVTLFHFMPLVFNIYNSVLIMLGIIFLDNGMVIKKKNYSKF